jgi:hypothetical protein
MGAVSRKSLSQREITNQLIIDKERYSATPRCRTLICFVYDLRGFCENPAALESDLAHLITRDNRGGIANMNSSDSEHAGLHKHTLGMLIRGGLR